MAYPIVVSLLATSAFAASFNNQVVCLGPYALCAAADCNPIPYPFQNGVHTQCTCAGPFNGLNIGSATSCDDRTNSLISTYSLTNPYSNTGSNTNSNTGSNPYSHPHGPRDSTPPINFPDTTPANSNGPKVYAIPCEGANAGPYADCRDAKCTYSGGKVVCNCPVEAPAANYYYGDKCPSTQTELTQLCTGIRSVSALPMGATAETLPGLIVNETLGPFYGGDVPVIHSCVVPT